MGNFEKQENEPKFEQVAPSYGERTLVQVTKCFGIYQHFLRKLCKTTKIL